MHCGEQGRVLAQLWNTHITSLEATVGALRGSNASLAAELGALKRDNGSLAKDMGTLDFLRREVWGGGEGSNGSV